MVQRDKITALLKLEQEVDFDKLNQMPPWKQKPTLRHILLTEYLDKPGAIVSLSIKEKRGRRYAGVVLRALKQLIEQQRSLKFSWGYNETYTKLYIRRDG